MSQLNPGIQEAIAAYDAGLADKVLAAAHLTGESQSVRGLIHLQNLTTIG